MAYSCVLHGWYSDYSMCPSCVTTVTTSGEIPTAVPPQPSVLVEEKKVDDKTALKLLADKITKQMNLLPDDPAPSERASYDAYLNCLNWCNELIKKQ